MPSFDFETSGRRETEEVRRIIETYAPRLSHREKKVWLGTVFTVTGEEPYLSNAHAELIGWRNDRVSSEAY